MTKCCPNHFMNWILNILLTVTPILTNTSLLQILKLRSSWLKLRSVESPSVEFSSSKFHSWKALSSKNSIESLQPT